MLKNWNWSDVWQLIGAGIILAIVTILGIYIFAPKDVDYYYLSTASSTDKGLGFCAYAHWTWHNDEIAYCSDDKDKVLDFVAKANASKAHK
jgi:hypothetical protein